MLRASNALTPNLHQTYNTLVRLAEGDKGVAWADQSMESLHDVSLAESQQALYESFLVHASPARRNIDPCGANSPSIAASLGILTNEIAFRNGCHLSQFTGILCANRCSCLK